MKRTDASGGLWPTTRRGLLQAAGLLGAVGFASGRAGAAVPGTEDGLNPLHERLPVHWDPVVVDTFEEFDQHVTNPGVLSSQGLLDPSSDLYAPESYGTQSVEVYLGDVRVALNGSDHMGFSIDADSVLNALNPQFDKAVIGGEEIWIVNGADIVFSTKTAITVLDWRPPCVPCAACRRAWCKFRENTLAHEQVHRRIDEWVIEYFNYGYAKEMADGMKQSDIDVWHRENGSTGGPEEYFEGRLREILEEIGLYNLGLHEKLHEDEKYNLPTTKTVRACACARNRRGDRCYDNVVSWRVEVSGWTREVHQYGVGGTTSRYLEVVGAMDVFWPVQFALDTWHKQPEWTTASGTFTFDLTKTDPDGSERIIRGPDNVGGDLQIDPETGKYGFAWDSAVVDIGEVLGPGDWKSFIEEDRYDYQYSDLIFDLPRRGYAISDSYQWDKVETLSWVTDVYKGEYEWTIKPVEVVEEMCPK